MMIIAHAHMNCKHPFVCPIFKVIFFMHFSFTVTIYRLFLVSVCLYVRPSFFVFFCLVYKVIKNTPGVQKLCRYGTFQQWGQLAIMKKDTDTNRHYSVVSEWSANKTDAAAIATNTTQSQWGHVLKSKKKRNKSIR